MPYPEPLNQAATKIGRSNRRTNTRPELILRSALHRQGLRFRKDYLLRVGGLRVKPDLVFTRQRVAVFVDGCYWHRCPTHATTPRRNLDYWLPKFQANVERDRRANTALEAGGWIVIRIWEHEAVQDAAQRIAEVIHRLKAVDREVRPASIRP